MFSNRVEIIPHNPDWSSIFQQEANKIKVALGSNCIDIHHIGSTSVPGLAAKPIIDMIPVVSNIQAVDVCSDTMTRMGYEIKGEFGIPFRRFFKKNGFNIHIYQKDNPEIERHLRFRDWIIEHPNDKEEYQELKIKLANEYPADISSYCMGKENFISRIDSLSGFKGFKIVTVLTNRELEAAKGFRKKYFFQPNNIENSSIYAPNGTLVDKYTWTFNHKDHKHFILYIGVDIVGYAHIQLWSDNRAAIRIIVIDEKYRGENYGKEFIALIERWLKLTGYKSVHTESSPTALGFYKRLNYEEMPFNDPNGYESESEDVDMGKIL